MTSPFHSFIWRGDNPSPSENPPISTEQLKDLAEGVKAWNVLGEEINKATKSGTSPSPPDAASQIKGVREMIKEARELAKEVNVNQKSSEEERKRPRYTVMDDGRIIPDPDGEMTLTEALIASRNLKSESDRGPLYYYQDPETGEFKAADRPVLLHQPTPPVTYYVTPEGEVQQLQPGAPIVLKQPSPPTPTPTAPTRSFLIHPDGSVEEVEPGKPVVVRQALPPAPSQPSAILPIQPTDGKGNPIGGAIPLPFDQFLQFTRTSQEMKHADERHNVLMDFITETKKEIPRIARALERETRTRESQGQRELEAAPGSSQEVKKAVREMDVRQCQKCGTYFGVPKGIKATICPNPQCPTYTSEE